ncbi:cyclin-D1-2 isoform X1 [Oryza glaberrima]|uniref:cyclin-D1-2 isoform X1 n=1 Tax=Oryza glaberrima TaxID=4538 RepID=UPI00224C4781|nr:cyclin-D1-2 isoform X1 [Oryza glaberrima]
MGAPAAGGGDDDRDVVFEYLLCTEEDAASAGSSFQQLQGLAPAVSLSPSTTTTAPAAAGSCDDCGEEEEEVWTVDVIAELIGVEAERSHSPRADYPGRPADLAARADSVAWILKVRELYGMLPVTAYLAVSYMDRFLSLHRLPGNGWAMQLLAVTCLSLAAKMEETLVPSILDLQIDTRYIFEPRTIFRMELLVLDALDWRLRSITPFTFMYLFAFKVDPNGKHIRELIHQATQVTLATIHDTEFLDHCPSSIAAAAVLCASSEIMQLVSIDHGTLVSWRIIGLDEEAIIRCYRLMQQLISSNNVGRESTEITMAATTTTATTAVSSEEVVSSSPPSKRRKMSPGT